MTDVRVQRDTTVTIQLNEEEAGKLLNLLSSQVDFEEEPWAEELYDSLVSNEIKEVDYEALT